MLSSCMSAVAGIARGRFMRSGQTVKMLSARSVSLDLRGVFPALTTPFNANETIAFEKLDYNISKFATVPFRGYLVQGSTGEVVSLTYDERVEMVKRVRLVVPKSGNRLVLAGPGCECESKSFKVRCWFEDQVEYTRFLSATRETIKLAVDMAAAGADAVVVVTPSYYKGCLTHGAIEQHYTRVADASPVPVILYSVPMNTGIDLDPDVVIRLSQHPNIVGVKDSGGDISKLAYMVHGTKSSGFQVLAGSTGFLMPAIDAGCVGGILALANILGRHICELFRLLDEGKRNEGCDLQHLLIAPNWAVTKKLGIAGVKQAMDWFGYYGGPTRSPILSLTHAEKEILRQSFKGAGFL